MSWYQSDINYSPQPYVPCEWSTGTDEEIVEAIEMHYAGRCDLTEYWAVGDERVVSLSAMDATGVGESHVQQNVTYVLSNIGGKYLSDGITECLFQVDQKDCLNEAGYMNSTQTNVGGWKSSARRTWCNEVYKNAIPSTLRGIFKEFINQSGLGGGSTSGVENTIDTFALRAEVEILNAAQNSVSGEGTRPDWYKTSPRAYKKRNSTNADYWLRSPSKNDSRAFVRIKNNGATATYYAYTSYGIAPFGVI